MAKNYFVLTGSNNNYMTVLGVYNSIDYARDAAQTIADNTIGGLWDSYEISVNKLNNEADEAKVVETLDQEGKVFIRHS